MLDFIFSQAFLAFCFTGLVCGFLSGFMGIGGGIIYVPAFFFLFKYYHLVPVDLAYHIALATSTVCILCAICISYISHHRNNNIAYDRMKAVAIGGFIGGILGGNLVWLFPTSLLKILFLLLCLFVLINVFWPLESLIQYKSRSFAVPVIGATIVGSLSILMATGASLLGIPLLRVLGIPPKQAIGSSTLLTFVVTITGTALYFLHAQAAQSNHYPLVYMYVFFPAVFCVIIASLIISPLGARLSHHVSPLTLRLFIALLVIIDLVHFAYSALHH